MDDIEQLKARIAELEAKIAAVAPAVDAQPVAEVVKWQTFTGHTAWDLKVFDKTLEHGAKLYASAQSEGLRKDAERYRWLRNDGFVPADFEKQIDAALSKHTGEKS
jgi:hypothetical protein